METKYKLMSLNELLAKLEEKQKSGYGNSYVFTEDSQTDFNSIKIVKVDEFGNIILELKW